MSRTINVNAVSRAAVIRLDSWQFTEVANQGEVGIGGFDLDDSALGITIPAMKAVTVDESAASTTRAFTGYTHERTTARGPNRVAGQRKWDVEVVDINALLDDYRLAGSGANRPEESDYTRITWLLTQELNTVGGVTAGVVPNTNTVTLDASDYRGRTSRDVLAEAAEAAGKNYFLYRYSSGPLLYYDKATGTSLTSTASISDVAADVNSSTVWAPVGEVTVKRSPDRVFSTVRLKYKRGAITVSNATTLSNFRRRDISLIDKSVKTSAKATAKANALLNGPAASEKITVSDLSIDVPAANVNDIRAGHRVQIKLARHDISSYTYYRVLRRTITPSPGPSDVRYRVVLTLSDDVLPSIFQGGRGGDEVSEETSNATDDNASVIIDASGITITGGAITVTNGSGTTIIDGTSEIFLICASGSMTVPANNRKGDVFKTVDVNTGVTVNPYTAWSVQSESDSAYKQPTPEIMHNLSGQIIRYFTGMAKHQGGGITRVRGLKGTTAPPLSARTFTYRIMKQSTFAIAALAIPLVEMLRQWGLV